MQHFFITGIGTGIGKTLLTCTLAWQLKQAGRKVTALKPVISGYDPEDDQNDTALILKSLGLPSTQATALSPWRYSLALAPDLAASRDEPPVKLDELIAFCHKASGADIVLVEGVGGVMSPVNDEATVRDWIKLLGWPAILVGGSYLGAISHTLTAYEALAAQGTKISALVVSESVGSGVTLAETCRSLKKFLPAELPVVQLPVFAGDEKWKHAPPLTGFIDA